MTRQEFDNRILECANYYVDNKSTVRETGKALGISKSRVHDYLVKYLKYINKDLYNKARKILDTNKKESGYRARIAKNKIKNS